MNLREMFALAIDKMRGAMFLSKITSLLGTYRKFQPVDRYSSLQVGKQGLS